MMMKMVSNHHHPLLLLLISCTLYRYSTSFVVSSPSSPTSTKNTVRSGLVSDTRPNRVTLSSSSLSASSTTKPDIMDVEYSDAELNAALNSLLSDSTNKDYDGRHILGYGVEGYVLSKLQKITATRILDYHKIMNDPSSPSEERLIAQWQTFATEYGPILNLQTVIQQQAPTMALAAEFKRASPSKGDIAVHLNAGEQAVKYTNAGANVISVLTENRWFKGSMEDLQQVRIDTTTAAASATAAARPAILRKEFVTNTYQIAEAAAYGADTILLIVAVLPQQILQELIDYARTTFHMEPLVEVHTKEELNVALACHAKVIGINNRNLHTFQLDLRTTNNLAAILDDRNLSYNHHPNDGDKSSSSDYTLCALSGMSTAMDVHEYRKIGIGMCLIGESLMRSNDPTVAIQSLCLNPDDYQEEAITGGGAYTKGNKLVKVCGITNTEDAIVACKNGANLIGIIFVPKSKRCVSDLTIGKEIVQAVQKFGERSQATQWDQLLSSSDSSTSEQNAVSSIAASSYKLQQAASLRPLVVGVFQNQDTDYINQVIEECGLDLIQLHGNEGMEACNRQKYRNNVPAIRVVDVDVDVDANNDKDAETTTEAGVQKLMQSLTSDPIALLLDTAIKGSNSGGGTGVTFDWSLAEKIQSFGLPVIIAGGLNPDNVGDAIQSTRPWGIDVSSGLEKSPGVKDHEKIVQFTRLAKETERKANEGM